MSSLREVNDDILKDWLDFREDTCYWNEKYYRNGFCDGVQLIGGCFEE